MMLVSKVSSSSSSIVIVKNATTTLRSRWRYLATSRFYVGQRCWKSTSPAATATASTASTTAGGVTSTSTSTSNNNNANVIELQHCPALPFVGSTIPQYSKTTLALKPSNIYDYWCEMTKQFGEFYTMGLPGIGSGWKQTVHMVQCPYEMMKVLKVEGKYPSGAAQSAWAIRKYMDTSGNHAAAHIIDQGPKWKRVRSFFQQDLLSPAAARQYVPAISESTRYASKGIIKYSNRNDLNTFFEDASFDMFSSLTLGSQTHITDPNVEADVDDVLFCRSVKTVLTQNMTLTQDPYQLIVGKMIGINTSFYTTWTKQWDVAMDIATKKVNKFLEKRSNGSLTDQERHSYLGQALDRQQEQQHKEQQEQEQAITQDECCQLVKGLLGASVDTTSGMTAWHFCHISMFPEVQDKIYEELVEALKTTSDNEGHMTAETVSVKNAPYLHAAFRESHRLTNPSPLVPMKRLPQDVEIHGTVVSKGNVVVMDTISKSHSEEYVGPDFDEYNPDRWLPDAVESRKGTKQSQLDHVLFKGPFSEGARRCPGSRVAKSEALLLIAQLVLDWKFTKSDDSRVEWDHWRDIPYQLDTVVTPKIPPNTITFTPRS